MRNLSVLILPRFLGINTLPKAKVRQHIQHQVVAHIRHLPRCRPIRTIPINKQLTPARHMLNQKRLHGPKRLIRKDAIQDPPLPRMKLWISPRDSTRIMLIPSHHIIKLGPFNISLAIEDIPMRLRRAEQQPIGSVADHIAIDLMTARNPHVSIASQRPVEIWEGRDSREQWTGILCQRAEP